VRAFKKLKGKKKSTRGDNFTHTPTSPPFSGGYQFLHAGSGAGRNQ